MLNIDYDIPETAYERRSSEVCWSSLKYSFLTNWQEPGQARRLSRPESNFGDLSALIGPDEDIRPSHGGSQRSGLFPWDHAGISSSSGMPVGIGSDKIHFNDHVEVRMRGSSLTRSRRGSSVVGSIAPVGTIASPASFKGSVGELAGVDVEFDGLAKPFLCD